MSERVDSRPELLFLCQVLPFPPDGGVYIRSYHVLALLSRQYRVTAVCLFRRAQQGSPESVAVSLRELAKLGAVEAHPIPQEWSRVRLLWDHLRSVLTARVYTKYAYESRAVRRRLLELRDSHDFSIVHLDSLDLETYLPLFDPRRVACTHHNLESALLRRRASRETSWFRAMYVRLQAAAMERSERFWAPRVATNIMVSDADAASMRRVSPESTVAVVTNGVDTSAFSPSPTEGDGEIVFVGGLNWFPNLDGLEYFCADILPLLRLRGVRAVVRWIGNASEEQKRQFAAKGVELTGYVEDIRPYLSRAACVVVPLRVGGGTRLKVLDAWAAGRAMVSTSVGAEGLMTIDGENILLRDAPEGFAEAVQRVLADADLRSRLETKGRQTVERHYSWPTIGVALAGAYAVFGSRSSIKDA